MNTPCYDVRVRRGGANIAAYRAHRGTEMTQALTKPNSAATSTNSLHLRSVRRIRDNNKASLATHERETGMYFAPYRCYDTDAARWATRDPLGMVDGPNVYEYIRGNPALRPDPTGLFPAKCYDEPPASSPGACDTYSCKDSYMGLNLKCFCENAGDSPLAQRVRSCLACSHREKTSTTLAHILCYARVSKDLGVDETGEGMDALYNTLYKCDWSLPDMGGWPRRQSS